jgi:DNA polymerase III subunit alpha
VERSSTYTILGPPKLPHFDSGEATEIGALRKLVERGFKTKLDHIDPDIVQTYRDRVSYEMKVIELANLSGYYLIVQDFVNDARRKDVLCSIARGSSAGSLVSYLIGINLIDPIPYGLLFSRFF